MANIHGIEVSGQTYDLEDTTARDGVQTNANDIESIDSKIPTSASSSNKLATEESITSAMDNVVDILNSISAQSGVTLSPECKVFKFGRLVVASLIIIKESGFSDYEKLLSGFPIPSGTNRTVNFNTMVTTVNSEIIAGGAYIDNSGNLYNRIPNGRYIYCNFSYFTDN